MKAVALICAFLACSYRQVSESLLAFCVPLGTDGILQAGAADAACEIAVRHLPLGLDLFAFGVFVLTVRRLDVALGVSLAASFAAVWLAEYVRVGSAGLAAVVSLVRWEVWGTIGLCCVVALAKARTGVVPGRRP